MINPPVRIINNKIYKKAHNYNKENSKINKVNQTVKLKKNNVLKENNINSFSKKFINNKKSLLHKKQNDDKTILKPLHSVNKNNNNILKPKPVLTYLLYIYNIYKN